VLDVEPPAADDPLLRRENVLLTPHVASLTAATYRALCVSTATNVVRVLRGETPEPRSVFRGA
jgi:D-3-phosphoglycerate dehydrogenase